MYIFRSWGTLSYSHKFFHNHSKYTEKHVIKANKDVHDKSCHNDAHYEGVMHAWHHLIVLTYPSKAHRWI